MKSLSILLVGLLCLNFAAAIEISADYSTDILVQELENQIEFTLQMKNPDPGYYNLYTFSDFSLKPSEAFPVSGNFFEKTFTLTPKREINFEKYYTFTYTINHRDVEKFEQRYTVKIVHIQDAIEVSSESIVPESDEISFYVENKEDVTLKNITARFSSILFDVEKTFDLKPFQKLTIPVEVDADKLAKTKAGVYMIKSYFQTAQGEKIIEGNLYLGEKKGISTIEDKSGFLIQTQTITKVNTGNVLESVQVEMKKNIISRLFTSFNIEPTIKERSGLGVKYTWTKDRLNPTESFIIKSKTNYVFPFLIIIVATLALFGFKRFSETKLEVKKSVNHVKTKNGEFALKIHLSIKAKKDIENVSLVDKIPAIVKIYKKFGMVKPDKIDPESRRIHWHIGDLNAGEERVFNYIVYSKVGVVGKFSLPSALAVFEKDGKIHEVESNQVFFMSDQVRN